jgi:hypothetical protein
MGDFNQNDPAAAAAVELRKRLRALAAGQSEAFDLLYHQFKAGSGTAAKIACAATRLPYLAALLADLAWTLGDHAAHDGTLPTAAPEAVEIKRVFRPHANMKQRTIMNDEQRLAVLAYLDALLAEVAHCVDLDAHAPSPTLAREARRFLGDFKEIRAAAAL